jgi:hypothetical protein
METSQRTPWADAAAGRCLAQAEAGGVVRNAGLARQPGRRCIACGCHLVRNLLLFLAALPWPLTDALPHPSVALSLAPAARGHRSAHARALLSCGAAPRTCPLYLLDCALCRLV